MARAMIGLLLALAACGSKAPPTDTAAGPLAVPDAAPLVTTCLTGKDCAAGEDCIGPEGCGVPWTCRPARPCTRDAVQYCTCDGRTVIGSSRCPPEPFKHRGPCN
jgi:hypothetical protein